jgi:hypothetical protein
LSSQRVFFGNITAKATSSGWTKHPINAARAQGSLLSLNAAIAVNGFKRRSF